MWPAGIREGTPGAASAPVRSPDTLILAVGDALRSDDGAGAQVLERLRQSPQLPSTVQLLDAGTEGLGLTLALGETNRAIIVDVAELGLRPGSWRRLTGARLDLAACAPGSSTHSAGLAEALTLAEALGLLPEELVLYAIQPLDLSLHEGLSVPVARAVPQVASAILEEVRRDDASGPEEGKAWRRSS
jgi:hydrogenase maturation protease